ncbi:MAG: prephenate dehydrogenase, partial [Methanobacterium sp.]
SALSEEIRILKNSIGKEVGLRHIYSDKIHIGILKELSPDFLVLDQNKKETSLKLSNVEVLSEYELNKWKRDNYPRKSYDISAMFPENSNPEVIVDTVRGLDGVVDASLMDVYMGKQIDSGKISITISYELINPDTRSAVETLLKGFGALIR